MSNSICDHTSVGIIVKQNAKILLIERKLPPFGFAPPAGHVDDKGSFENAAKEELEEEVGLTCTSLKLLAEGRKENPCPRENGTWHYWKIYQAETEGIAKRSLEETKQVGWYSLDNIKTLSQRTEAYLEGNISQEEWETNPGLTANWYEWFKELRILS